MSYTLVQAANANSRDAGFDGQPTFVLALPGNSTIGNLLFFAGNSDHTQAPTLTPSGLGTWTQIGTIQNEAGNNQDCTIWFAIVTSVGTNITFTATGGAATLSGAALTVVEISSSLGFDPTPLVTSDTTKAFASTTTSTNAETSNNVTPSAGDLVVGAFQDGNNQSSITAGTGFTIGTAELGHSAATGAAAIDFQSAAGGSQNAKFTVGTAGQQYTVQIAVFKSATSTPATQIVAPAADVSTGAWLAEPGDGATNLYQQIDEAVLSATDYIQSSQSPVAADIYKLRIAPLQAPAKPRADGAFHFRVDHLKDIAVGDNMQLTVKLYAADGVTLIKAWTPIVTGAETTSDLTLTGAEADTIPDVDFAVGLVLAFEALKV